MQEEGVSFKCNVNVGSDLSAKDLIIIMTLLFWLVDQRSKRPKNPRKRFKWCSLCYGFFDLQNKICEGDSVSMKKNFAKNKDVVVIGGGDTGSDCIGTSNRQGANQLHN